MEIVNIYSKIKGDYYKAYNVFKSDALLEKFLKKFIEANELELLNASIKENNHEESFRHAHTFKGMAMSLYLSDLANVSQKLVDLYKNEIYNDKKINSLYKKIEAKFNKLKKLLK
jgi:HPt (histidine-containing phosphotransfer) domain-containing protein